MSWQKCRPLLWLAAPFMFYMIPVFGGYAWNSLGPGTPNVPAMEYQGRSPNIAISIEQFGTGVVVVPFHARLRDYIKSGELPLWNPYQGLGQPFAAQGESNPYFPFSVLRALLPYSLDNYVTFLVYYLSAVFLYLFLRGLGLSEKAAIFGGVAYVMSGALSLHIARPNIADQLCMIPVLFWGAAKAMRERSVVWYVIFAVVAALHLLGGFIQIAMISAVLFVAFCLVYMWSLSGGRKEWFQNTLTILAVFILGNGLAAFYLLPFAEAMRISFNPRSGPAAFLATPFANVISFFFPVLFGQFFQSWVPGSYPDVTDWNNLYAYAGTGVLLLNVIGWTAFRCADRQQRRLFFFFAFAGLFLLLRYISFPLVAGVNILPILSRQTPKHANGLTVFCFIVAAAFAVEFIGRRYEKHSSWWIAVVYIGLVSSVMTLIGRRGGLASINTAAAGRYISVSVFISAILLFVLWLARRWARLSTEGIATVLTAVVAGELTVYIPLGNSRLEFLEARLVLFALIVGGGLLAALKRPWAARGVFALTLAGYTVLIFMPSVGLPKQFDVDTPPKFMAWLKQAVGNDYRTFGIAPDFSSLAGIQDLGVVGPFAPREFSHFVALTSADSVWGPYQGSGHFSLTLGNPQSLYDLKDYLRTKPIFDWLGVRYLVLDRNFFHPGGVRTDHLALLSNNTGVRMAYGDDRVMIVESLAAHPKSFFSPVSVAYPNQEAILKELKQDPSSILGPPKVEAASVPWPNHRSFSGKGEAIPLKIKVYRPNLVRLNVEAPEAGIVVLKDSYFPGWRATLNGSPSDVIRVNGLVRGVVIPRAGQYDVEFVYRPEPFIQGIWLAGVIGLFMLSAIVYAVMWRQQELSSLDPECGRQP